MTEVTEITTRKRKEHSDNGINFEIHTITFLHLSFSYTFPFYKIDSSFLTESAMLQFLFIYKQRERRQREVRMVLDTIKQLEITGAYTNK